MNILILHSASLRNYPSGEYKVAYNDALLLKKKGQNVYFIEYKPFLNNFLPSYFIKFKALIDSIWSLESFFATIFHIKKNKPDIVHVHGLFPYLSISCLLATKLCNVPLIQTLHNGRWLCIEGGFYRTNSFCNKCLHSGNYHGFLHGCNNGRIISFILFTSNIIATMFLKTFNLVSRFIAVSDFIKEQHVIGGFPDNKIIVKSNAINFNKINNISTKKSRQGITYLGRISNAKGSHILKLLIDSISEPINIIGDGPDLLDLQSYCYCKNYTHVIFFGTLLHEDCFKILSSSVCSVVPSKCGESFSLSAAESLALSTPVVGFDVGGLGSLLRRSGGGILVDQNDDQEFIKSAINLLSHSTKANRLGELGKKFVENNLNSDLSIKYLHRIYEDVLQQTDKSNCADYI